MIVLAGDIGGTKTHLGLFTRAEPKAPLVMTHQEKFASRGYVDLESLCAGYLKGRSTRPDAAAFGIAGPIVNSRCEATNLPWVIEQASLERLLSCPVTMLNDLESMAHGVAELRPDEVLTLNPGVHCFPSSAQVSAGTLTLNGPGPFIFKVTSTFITFVGSSVILTGGATCDNIFWLVGSSATLGGPVAGNILAYTSIGMDLGATLSGRAIALNGAVTMSGQNGVSVCG